jgi:hypothetical protein
VQGDRFPYRVDTEAALGWILETVQTSSQPSAVNDIVISGPSAHSLAAGSAADTGKAKHQNHGKAKGEKGTGRKDHGRS